MLIWYLSELEAQEPRHVSHGHGVEVSASFKGPRSLVFFLGSIKRLTCRTCSRLSCYYYYYYYKDNYTYTIFFLHLNIIYLCVILLLVQNYSTINNNNYKYY
ncbi:hypothetical protein V8G54_020995, partial [Vigna mungo]